jgi:hypothetical protein
MQLSPNFWNRLGCIVITYMYVIVVQYFDLIDH